MAVTPEQVQIGNYTRVRIQTGTNPGDPAATPPVPASPIYTDLYGERDNERSDEREGIDASHKGSKHNITIPGRRSGELSMTLVANRADVTAVEEPSQAALQDIYEAGTAVTFQHVRSYPGAPVDGSGDKVRQASGVLLSLSESASDNEVVTYDATLTLNEALTPVA